ncbi:MAG: ComEC/Rec2 family competence protein [Clostridia bacterium]|nr:ComEC/Rec2 family competence protein [Clostridia bacterium]
MKHFENRKFLLLLLLFVLLFTVYILVPFFSGANIALLAAVLVFAAAVLGGVRAYGAKELLFIFLALATAFSSIAYAVGVKGRGEIPLAYADGCEHEVCAEITQVSFVSAYEARYSVRVIEIDGEASSFFAVLDISSGDAFEYGDIIVCSASFEPVAEKTAYLRGKNIFVRAAADGAYKSGTAGREINYYIQKANAYLSGRMVDMLGEDAGGFCAALIFGNRSYIGAGVRLDFARTGISHLLALSGLHLSVVAQTLDFLLRGFMKKKPRNIVLIAVVFAFAVFTGLSVSVLRAAIMLAFVFAADMVGEENDSLTALFAAAVLVLLVDGNAVYDIAFYLSVCATLGIILVRPAADGLFAKWQKPKKNKLLRALHGICKYFYGIFAMTLAATFFTLPVTYFSFGEVSLIGVLSNFVFLPLASALLVLCVFFVPLSFVPYVHIPVAYLCGCIAKLLLLLAEKISNFEGIYVSLNYPFAPYIFALLAAALFLCIFVRKLTVAKIGALALAFALSFSVCFSVYKNITAENVRITVACEGTREFVSADICGENYVFDISTGGYAFMMDEAESVTDFADTEIDNLVLTHYHIYHENSIYRLSDAVKIRNVLLPTPETEAENEDFGYIRALLARLGIPYEVYTRGVVWENGDVSIDFAPRCELSRSAKPIVAFAIKCNNAEFAYIESSAFESNFDYSAYLAVKAVFVGGHGPVRKFPVSAYALAGAGRVIFAEGVREYFRDTECLANAYDIADFDGKISILYKGVN